MDWTQTIQQVLDGIEQRMTEELNSEILAKECHLSVYHFQRVFGALCGYSVGEYIRNRRMSLAREELTESNRSILEIALRYQYESSESFSRAFRRFYGVNPSTVRKSNLRLPPFEHLCLNHGRKGGETMTYKIQTMGPMYFLGYKKHLAGVPSDRYEQERDLFVHTRLQQYALQGLVKDCETCYTLISEVDDEGYDFYIAAQYGQKGCWLTEERYKSIVEFNPEIGRMFEKIVIPAATYAVFETKQCVYPVEQQGQLRRDILSEWMPGSEFQLTRGMEIAKMCWKMGAEREKRSIELWMPVEKR